MLLQCVNTSTNCLWSLNRIRRRPSAVDCTPALCAERYRIQISVIQWLTNNERPILRPDRLTTHGLKWTIHGHPHINHRNSKVSLFKAGTMFHYWGASAFFLSLNWYDTFISLYCVTIPLPLAYGTPNLKDRVSRKVNGGYRWVCSSGGMFISGGKQKALGESPALNLKPATLYLAPWRLQMLKIMFCNPLVGQNLALLFLWLCSLFFSLICCRWHYA